MGVSFLRIVIASSRRLMNPPPGNGKSMAGESKENIIAIQLIVLHQYLEKSPREYLHYMAEGEEDPKQGSETRWTRKADSETRSIANKGNENIPGQAILGDQGRRPHSHMLVMDNTRGVKLGSSSAWHGLGAWGVHLLLVGFSLGHLVNQEGCRNVLGGIQQGSPPALVVKQSLLCPNGCWS